MDEKLKAGDTGRNSDISLSAGQQMIASCSGAILTSVFVTPLDVVKVRLQAQQRPAALMSQSMTDSVFGSLYRCFCSYCKPETQCFAEMAAAHVRNCTHCTLTMPTAVTRKFTGTMDAVLKICRYEGVRSLWSGLSPALLISVPQTVIYYSTYDQLKYYMGYRETNPATLYIAALAGAISRVGAVTVVSPLELVRTKMQSQRLSGLEIVSAVQGALHNSGPRVLMQGLGPTLLRDVPFSAIYWYGYESLKSLMLKQKAKKELAFQESFMAGAVSGTVAAVMTLPFDVIKTHQQMALGAKASTQMATLPMIQQLYRTRGVQSLFAGFVPRVVKVAPACAIMISSYEFSKAYLTRLNATRLGVDIQPI